MRAIQFGAAAALLACASPGRCASVIVESQTHPGGVAYAFFLDGGVHNGMFNVVEFSVKPVSASAPFINQDTGLANGAPRLPGEPFSFLNRGIPFTFDGPPEELEIGDWPKLGPKNLPTEVAYATGPLGQQIDTRLLQDGRLFLANVMLPSAEARFTGAFLIVGGGNLLQTITIPEPATGALGLACAGTGLLMRRIGFRLMRRKLLVWQRLGAGRDRLPS
jgi:hypothetical protein